MATGTPVRLEKKKMQSIEASSPSTTLATGLVDINAHKPSPVKAGFGQLDILGEDKQEGGEL